MGIFGCEGGRARAGGLQTLCSVGASGALQAAERGTGAGIQLSYFKQAAADSGRALRTDLALQALSEVGKKWSFPRDSTQINLQSHSPLLCRLCSVQLC